VAGLADVPSLPRLSTAMSPPPVSGVRSPPTEFCIKSHRGTEMILEIRRYRRYEGTGGTGGTKVILKVRTYRRYGGTGGTKVMSEDMSAPRPYSKALSLTKVR